MAATVTLMTTRLVDPRSRMGLIKRTYLTIHLLARLASRSRLRVALYSFSFVAFVVTFYGMSTGHADIGTFEVVAGAVIVATLGVSIVERRARPAGVTGGLGWPRFAIRVLMVAVLVVAVVVVRTAFAVMSPGLGLLGSLVGFLLAAGLGAVVTKAKAALH